MQMLLRMKICILDTHANLSLFFPDSNWYISVVLFYVIGACVTTNKRYSNLGLLRLYRIR